MKTLSQRIPIAEGIGFTEILDAKFKTNALRIQFYQPLSSETAAACALACDLVTSSSKAYPSNACMNRKLHLLYGANLSCSISKRGDMQILSLSISSIADRYALEGEAVFQELSQILFGCLLEPNCNDGGFEETEFRIKQKNLLDAIDAEINEKRKYAIRQAGAAAYVEEPAAISCYGTRTAAEALTPQSVYAAFQTLLQTASAEIYFAGPSTRPELPQQLKDVFGAIANRSTSSCAFLAPSPIKAEPVTKIERLPVNQCKMVMVWKTPLADQYTVRLMAAMLGGTPSSKLFANVREKMSLCYYCAANYAESKQTMMVDCGVESDNVQRTKTAIAEQLEAICQGDFTEEELENTKIALRNSLLGVGDSTSSYFNWYFGQFCRGTAFTPEEENQCYSSITREQIVAAAKSMKLDTIYIMEQKEQEDASYGNN